jgi:spoIIIJ-associated protein
MKEAPVANQKNSSSSGKKKDDGARPIYAIARALDMSSKELRETISSWDGIDWDVSSHMKKLSVEQQEEIEKRLDVTIATDDDDSGKSSKKGGQKKSSKKDSSDSKKDDSKKGKQSKGGQQQKGGSQKGKQSKGGQKKDDQKKSSQKGQDSGDKGQKKEKSEPEEDYVGIGKEWLVECLERMGFSHPRVSGSIDDKVIEFNISGADTASLIRSKNAAAKTDVIDSLQQIMERVLFGNDRNSRSVILDVQSFRSNRVDELSKASKSVADYVRETGNKLRFGAMNSFDRRAFHVGFREDEEIRTQSNGYGVRRRLEVWQQSGNNNDS